MYPCSLALFMYKIVELFNSSSLKPPERNFTIFHMGPSVEVVLTICSNGSAPSNKMAIMSMYGKKILKIISRTKKVLRLNLSIYHRGLKVDQQYLHLDILHRGQSLMMILG